MNNETDCLARALAAHQCGDLDTAEQGYRIILRQQPDHVDALHYLGLLLHQRGKAPEGIALMAASVARLPEHLPYLRHLAFAYSTTEQHVLAADTLLRYLALAPHDAEAHTRLASHLRSLLRHDDALAHIEQALILEPSALDARFYRALIAIDRRQIQSALGDVIHVANAQPTYPQVMQWLLYCLASAGQLDAIMDIVLAQWEHALQTDRLLASDFAFYLLHSDRCNDAEVLARTQSVSCVFYDDNARPANPPPNFPASSRKTIAFIGSDFHYHVMMYFLLPLVQQLDFQRFRWQAYHNGRADHVTADYCAAGLEVIPIQGLVADEVSQLIRANGVDILIDLNAHSGLHRLDVLAQRPAPIQLSWLGYAASTGLAAIDYRITDAWVDPLGQTEQWHSEQLLRLPTALPFGPPEASPDITPLPFLQNGYITFGALNRPAKSAGMLEAYADILARVPDSRLLMFTLPEDSNPDLVAAYLAPFEQRGLRDRVQCLSSHRMLEDFLAVISGIDIALDSYPYSGGVTTFHTLWMGVPIITRRGGRSVSRVTAGILDSLGYAEWVAESEADFVARAISLAANSDRLVQVRDGLRSQLRASAWCDVAQIARRLEAALDGLLPAQGASQ